MKKEYQNLSDVFKKIFTSEYLGIVVGIAVFIGCISGVIYGVRLEKHCMNGHSRTYHRMGYDENGDFHTDYETKTLQAEICESKGIDDGFMIKTIFKHIFISLVLTLALTILIEYLNLAIKYKIIIYVGLALLVFIFSILISSSKINSENKEKEDKKKAQEAEQLRNDQIEPFTSVWFAEEFNYHYDVTLSIFDDNTCYYSYYNDQSKDKLVRIDKYSCTYTYKNDKVTIKADESFTCSVEDKKLVCDGIMFDTKYKAK